MALLLVSLFHQRLVTVWRTVTVVSFLAAIVVVMFPRGRLPTLT